MIVNQSMDKKKSWKKKLLKILGMWLFLFLLGEAIWIFFIFPWASNWGATPAERARSLPGDELVPNATDQSTYAVTINAPPAEVWKWLIQLGQDRGGFYSLSFLENLVGANIHNRLEIRPEWQERKLGELVRLAPPPRTPGTGFFKDPALPILAVEPPRYLHLQNWGAFVLEPAEGGRSTRFLIRGKNDFGLPARLGMALFLQPIHFIMQRRMMLGIKEVAEAGPEKPAIPSPRDYAWFFSLAGGGLLIILLTLTGLTLKKFITASVAAALITLGLLRLPPSPVFGLGTLILVLIALGWLFRTKSK